MDAGEELDAREEMLNLLILPNQHWACAFNLLLPSLPRDSVGTCPLEAGIQVELCPRRRYDLYFLGSRSFVARHVDGSCILTEDACGKLGVGINVLHSLPTQVNSWSQIR